MKTERNILSIMNEYDTFFLDVYGVLYNGLSLYEGTLETMQKLKQSGKKVVIVSNTTMVSKDSENAYAKKGMLQGIHYDMFVTSGEYLHYILSSQSQQITEKLDYDGTLSIKCLFMGNASLFAGSQISKIDSFDDAQIMYVGVPRSSYGRVRIDDLLDEQNRPVKIEDVIDKDWHTLHDPYGQRGPMEFAVVLEKCLEKNKLLLIANPDIFAHEAIVSPDNKVVTHKGVPVFTQGTLGKYYEKMGGKVLYFGKPYKGIFEFAKKVANVDSGDKSVMVGDTPWTDILGANGAGIDSAMVLTGVIEEFLKRNMPAGDKNGSMTGTDGNADESLRSEMLSDPIALEKNLNQVFEKISEGMLGITCQKDDVTKMRPMHVLEQFSESR